MNDYIDYFVMNVPRYDKESLTAHLDMAPVILSSTRRWTWRLTSESAS